MGLKWPWSTQHSGPMSKMHGPGLLSTPWPFWKCILTSVKMMMKMLLLEIIWLYLHYYQTVY